MQETINPRIFKELKDFAEMMKGPIRYEKKPIRFNELTGEPIEYAQIPIYAEPRDKRLGIEGCFSVMIDRDLKEDFLKFWKPVVLNEKEVMFPVDGYGVLYYQLADYVSLK